MRCRTNYRKLISKSVICRRAGKHPLQSTCNILFILSCPRVICTLWPKSKSLVYNIKEINKTNPTLVRSIRTQNIPSLEGIWIIQVTAWHSGKTLEMLRKKSLIYSQEKQEKMSLSMMLWILTSGQFTYPEVKSCKNSKNSTHTLYIMKMSYDIISLKCTYTHYLCYHKDRTLSYQNI